MTQMSEDLWEKTRTSWYAVFDKRGLHRYEPVENQAMAIALHLEGWKKIGICNGFGHGIIPWENLKNGG